MLELIQFPYSPYCIVQRRILEYSGRPFKIKNIRNDDRSPVWKITRQRYYQVPVLRDGDEVLFETDGESQVIAKYLDSKLELGLFPREWEGIQDILWVNIEEVVEGFTFRLNDIYWQENIPEREQLGVLRHKERKFGRGCFEQWKQNQDELLSQLEQRLVPYERMLATRDFLLDDRPRFVDFDLFGMLENFLYSGHYALPPAHSRLARWHTKMKEIRINQSAREKLHS